MLRINLEVLFNELVNAPSVDPNSPEEISNAFQKFTSKVKRLLDNSSVSNNLEFSRDKPGRVFLGRDTRITSPVISDLIKLACSWLGTEVVDFGE